MYISYEISKYTCIIPMIYENNQIHQQWYGYNASSAVGHRITQCLPFPLKTVSMACASICLVCDLIYPEVTSQLGPARGCLGPVKPQHPASARGLHGWVFCVSGGTPRVVITHGSPKQLSVIDSILKTWTTSAWHADLACLGCFLYLLQEISCFGYVSMILIRDYLS